MFQRKTDGTFTTGTVVEEHVTRPSDDLNITAEVDFQRKIRSETDQIYNSLNELINTCSLQNKDKSTLTQEKYMMKAMASSMVKSAETLFSITVELKRAHLFDFHALSAIAEERKKELRLEISQKQMEIGRLKALMSGKAQKTSEMAVES
ncbi:hypothetical protein H4219_000445 [Mycoemilia scoparia]|uniref:Uncharacterized protein n=1 Tax=Mycoemilia scoparia TaxID=417184 RepID=A0A9W8A303_9FUNG|nr:hypothetical protein H4219_000445 [Mycoemilia scoparia]